MYCPKCGKEIADGSKFCENCGASFAGSDFDAKSVLLKFAESQLTTLLIGIISVVSVPVLMGALAASSSMVESMFGRRSSDSGGAGVGFVIVLIIAGWVLLATRHYANERKGGALAAAVLYSIGFILGLIAEQYLFAILALLAGAICVCCVISLNSKK